MSDERAPDAPLPARKGRRRLEESAATSLVGLLDVIRRSNGITRHDLELTTDMGRAVVADRLALLTKLGLVDETAIGTTSGGRAPRLVRLNMDCGRVLTAALNRTTLSVGIANLAGKLLIEHHEECDFTGAPEELLERLTTLFNWILTRHEPAAPAWAIMLALPGIVSGADGMFLKTTPATIADWAGFPLVEELTRRFGVPVWMRSRVDSMAMGEFLGGAGHGAQTMLFVRLESEIRAGLIVAGREWRGADGATGLLGAVMVPDGDKMVTLDAAAGYDAIQRRGRQAAERGTSEVLAQMMRRRGDVTAPDIAQAAQMGDPVATAIVTDAGRLIGQVLATLTNTLNPELIVLSGQVVESSDMMLAAIREAVYAGSHALVTRDLKIVRTQMSRSAGLAGAARAATELMFAPDFLRDWILAGSPLNHPRFVEFRESDELRPAPGGNASSVIRLKR